MRAVLYNISRERGGLPFLIHPICYNCVFGIIQYHFYHQHTVGFHQDDLANRGGNWSGLQSAKYAKRSDM